MEKAAEPVSSVARLVRCIGSFLLLMVSLGAPAQDLFNRKVSVQAEQVRLSTALGLVAKEGGFKLSYNAAAIPVDSLVNVYLVGVRAEDALRSLVPSRLKWKESGSHVILIDARSGRRKVRIEGRVVDAANGAGISRASVYAVEEREAVTSSDDGRFNLEISTGQNRIAVMVARATYHDTLVFASADGEIGTVALRKRDMLERIDPRCELQRCEVEEIGMARLFVPADRMQQAANIEGERRRIQASLWPAISTNGPVNGAMINRYSFNLLAGYARGLEGIELGVGANIERNHVSGLQVAGMANLVGGDAKGLQVAGFHNHVMRSIRGVQVAGFGNTVWDTLTGVQIAGGVNVVRGGMTGTQIAGALNLATRDVDGVQVAGAVNVTVRDVNKTQAAGALNYGRNVRGTQFAGAVNVALGRVGGGQIASALNYARSVTGGQVAAGMNVAVDSVRGGQVGVLNVARVVQGGQVGILNFSDTISGVSVGILSFAWRGYHRLDAVYTLESLLSIQFRTGTRPFHNIIGYSPRVLPEGRWGFLYGFGFEPRIGKQSFIDIDLTAEQIVEQREWVDAVNILGRFSVRYSVISTRSFTFTAGPVVNLLVSDWRDAGTGAYLSSLAPDSPPLQWREGRTTYTGWFGGLIVGAGLRF